MIENSNIAFIGCGNMARSLIGGLIANGMSPNQLSAADPDASQRQLIADQFGINTSEDNSAVIEQADVIVLAIKPQIMHAVVSNMASIISDKACLTISIAAGVRLDSIQSWIGNTAAIVRVMPNTPALIQAGAAALFANEQTSETQRNIAESMMRSVGTAVWIEDEILMDSVTALSGSGPAYFFYMMEAMEKAGEKLGLSAEQSRLLTIETAVGAAKMALLSSSDPGTLRQQVTSPGGTTEQALNVLMDGELETLMEKAITAAQQRSVSLSEEFGK